MSHKKTKQELEILKGVFKLNNKSYLRSVTVSSLSIGALCTGFLIVLFFLGDDSGFISKKAWFGLALLAAIIGSVAWVYFISFRSLRYYRSFIDFDAILQRINDIEDEDNSDDESDFLDRADERNS